MNRFSEPANKKQRTILTFFKPSEISHKKSTHNSEIRPPEEPQPVPGPSNQTNISFPDPDISCDLGFILRKSAKQLPITDEDRCEFLRSPRQSFEDNQEVSVSKCEANRTRKLFGRHINKHDFVSFSKIEDGLLCEYKLNYNFINNQF